jgi:hypothetical protein
VERPLPHLSAAVDRFCRHVQTLNPPTPPYSPPIQPPRTNSQSSSVLHQRAGKHQVHRPLPQRPWPRPAGPRRRQRRRAAAGAKLRG